MIDNSSITVYQATICATFGLPLPNTADAESYPDQEWMKSRCSLMETILVQATLTLHTLFRRSSKK